MSETIQPNVDTNSAEFEEGVEAGLNSTEDTNNWQAGNELGQELKDEREHKEPVAENPSNQTANSLFTSDSLPAKDVSLQDEKDVTEE